MGLKKIFSKKRETDTQNNDAKNADVQNDRIQNTGTQNAGTQSAGTLAEDIPKAAEWVVNALNVSGYKADYTLESMKEVDRFFDEQSGSDGILAKGNRGSILFSLGSYVGQTVIRLYGGRWITDDSDPQGEINIAVETANGVTIWPVIRCMKRYKNGAEDSVYALVYSVEQKSLENI